MQTATWQSRLGRFRVYTKKNNLKHKQVRKWKNLIENGSADCVMMSLTDCCKELLGELDEEATVEATDDAEDAPASQEAAAGA